MIENVLNAARLATVCEDAWFVKAISIGQFFMTGPEFDAFDNSSVCREYTHPRDHPAAYTKGSSGVKTKFGPALEVIVTKRHDMYGVEITIDSMQRDGTKLWVVTRRSI